MDISSCMKTNVISIPDSAKVSAAAGIFVKHHVGLLPIVNELGQPVGVVGVTDMLSLELPDFVNFVADVDFVHDFGAIESTRPPAAKLAQSIRSLMKPAISVPRDCGLLRAYALMLQHNLHDILVVASDGKLIGIASRVDIGVAILSAWKRTART